MKKSAVFSLLFCIFLEQGISQSYTKFNYGKEQNEVGQKSIILNDSTILLFGFGAGTSYILYKVKTNGDTIFSDYEKLPDIYLGTDILKCPDENFIVIGNQGMAKINGSGEIIWSVRNDTVNFSAGTIVNDTCFAIAGERLIFSHVEETPDYGPDSVFYFDIYISLYNQSGKLLKDLTYSFVDGESETSRDILVNSTGNLAILGSSYKNGLPNEFLLTTDMNFTVKLDTLFEYPGIYIGYQMTINENNNYIICGEKFNNWENEIDILFQEISENGIIEKEKTFDMNGNEIGYAVMESDGYYYLTGRASNKRNASDRFSEIFMLKLDCNGDTIYSHKYTLPENQYPCDIQEMNDSMVVIFGTTFYNTNGGGDFQIIYINKSSGFTNLTISGINPIVSKDEIRLYPNPAEDVLYIEGGFIESISIIDYSGRIIRSLTIGDMDQGISLKDLKPGVYIVRLATKNGFIHRKIIKQ